MFPKRIAYWEEKASTYQVIAVLWESEIGAQMQRFDVRLAGKRVVRLVAEALEDFESLDFSWSIDR